MYPQAGDARIRTWRSVAANGIGAALPFSYAWSAACDPSGPERPRRNRPQPEDARRSRPLHIRPAKRIKKIVDGMPPLTDEQLSKLAVLLQPWRVTP